MSDVNDIHADQDVDQRIRVRAYLMWEADGKPNEPADLYWHRALDASKQKPALPFPRPKPASIRANPAKGAGRYPVTT
jgi:Protein of unknown function (DUF2934)